MMATTTGTTILLRQSVQQVDQEFEAGSTFTPAGTVNNPDGTPKDLTGYVFRCQYRDALTGALLLEPTVVVSGNAWSIPLTPANTRDDIGPGRRKWGLEWTDPDGNETPLAEGNVTVNAEMVHD